VSTRGTEADAPLRAARASGLVAAGRPLLVMLSGGGDSVCLLDVAVRLGAQVSALHVDHGLRAESGEDAAFCRELCERLGVPLVVERVDLPAARGSGNVQAQAREVRYSLAARHAASDYAAAHTASDQAETVLYRLAVSQGRRALLGMAPRRGRLVRPLLAITRAEAREYCRARGLDWREDPSNSDVGFARARVRAEVLPALRALNPEAERNIAETAAQLREEGEVMDAALADALSGVVGPPAGTERGRVRPSPAGEARGEGLTLSLAALRGLPPALARLALRTAAGDVAVSRADAERVLALPDEGSGEVHLAGGIRAVAEYGRLRFARDPQPRAPEPVGLPVPGAVDFGEWHLEAALAGGAGGPDPGGGEGGSGSGADGPGAAGGGEGGSGPAAGGADGRGAAGGGEGGSGPAAGAPGAAGRVLLHPRVAVSGLLVRPWRPGDRMRPAGLGGTKTLQDLFTDRKVPRAERARVPVVESEGQVAWVAGVAVDERFRADPAADAQAVALSARRPA
jgi:tRNA(Ile)-lysidine synthase